MCDFMHYPKSRVSSLFSSNPNICIYIHIYLTTYMYKHVHIWGLWMHSKLYGMHERSAALRGRAAIFWPDEGSWTQTYTARHIPVTIIAMGKYTHKNKAVLIWKWRVPRPSTTNIHAIWLPPGRAAAIWLDTHTVRVDETHTLYDFGMKSIFLG